MAYSVAQFPALGTTPEVAAPARDLLAALLLGPGGIRTGDCAVRMVFGITLPGTGRSALARHEHLADGRGCLL